MNHSEDKESKKKNSENGVPKGAEELNEILQFIENTDLEFVQIEKEGKKIVLKRSSSVFQKKEKAVELAALSEKVKEEEGPQVFSIRSPIVGRFYSSMGADRPPLVVEGGRVTAGQKVAIVEAMKIKKEVFSAYTGKVVKIWVQDGDPVEYGQDLFSVEPEL